MLVRLATTLASVDVETPEFYRQVLSTVTAPKTVPSGLPAGGAEEAEDRGTTMVFNSQMVDFSGDFWGTPHLRKPPSIYIYD